MNVCMEKSLINYTVCIAIYRYLKGYYCKCGKIHWAKPSHFSQVGLTPTFYHSISIVTQNQNKHS